ncbi:MAG: exodeoxyribonuclease III [Alloprevotella sp.]
MKFISWNVNGLRACCGKGFAEAFASLDADFFCLQETKMQPGQLDLAFEGYRSYWNAAEKKGYSGTAIFTRHEPLQVTYGLGLEQHDHEGRVITLEMPAFYLVTVYTPNSQDGLRRLDYRMEWDDAFRAYLQRLDAVKPVVVCGDLNVAHREIDLKNPKTNRKNAGFTDEERAKFGLLLEAGFTDTFRHFYPDVEGVYSWWSYRFKAREKNAGWRIDYFLVSDRLQPGLRQAAIHNEVYGSDHCPVEVVVDFDNV